MSLIQNKKRYFVLLVIFSTLALFLGRVDNCKAASRYQTDRQMRKKYGTYYAVFSMTALKFSDNKVSITGTLLKKDLTITKHKKRTYKLAKTMKEYMYVERDGSWEYYGKKPRSEFKKNLRNEKRHHFPSVHFWVKNGIITAYGLSA